LGHLGHAPLHELQKNLVYGQNITLEKLPQWKITEIVATRCQISRLKRTKFDFGMGLHPRPRWRSLQHFPRPVAGFKGSCISKGKEGKEGGEERVRGGQWKGRGRRWTAPFPNS